MRKSLLIAFIAAGALALASCGAARPSKYYALDLPSSLALAARPGPVTLLIGHFSAPHLYRDDRIVYRTGTTQIGTYEYHRWAEPPADMLEGMLLHVLRMSGKYSSVQRMGSNTRGDYILRGRLHQLEEVSDNGLMARVAFEIELYEQKSGTTVWSRYYSADEPVSGKEVPDVVQAMNRNVKRGIAEVAAGLDQFFARQASK